MELFPVGSPTNNPNFPIRTDHPVPRQGIDREGSQPLSTNKFYANLFLGNRTQAVWLHPFSVWWSNGTTGPLNSYGLSVAHTEAEQRAFGPDPNANPIQYYFNPIGIGSLCFSAVELGVSTTDMRISHLEHLSARMKLELRTNPSNSLPKNLDIPLVQGSGFITATYRGLTPRFDSGVFFRSVERIYSTDRAGKWRLTLEDGNTWLLYAFPGSTPFCALQLNQRSNARLESEVPWIGTIQITKVPRGSSGFEALADACAGCWATSVGLTATADEYSSSSTKYAFDFHLAHQSRGPNLLTYALPHHIESFTTSDSCKIYPNFQMQSTTKGKMTAVVSSTWVMQENHLPDDITFDIRQPAGGVQIELDPPAKEILSRVAREEAQGDPASESNLDSMYFSGKALDKYACMCWVIAVILQDRDLAQQLLAKIKGAFARFAENRQRFPLFYESAWGGIVSSAMYQTGDILQDFGNGGYNDHHFHWGYFVHTAALIAQIDHSLNNGTGWLDANRLYIDSLVRDAASANPYDPNFPLSRAFDWFHGHSWAKGLFDSADGKDEESTSEDAYFSYSLKLWGIVTGDKALEQRANLMLAIQKRVFNSYFLLQNNNVNQPAQFIANKVTGILFENKVDHTTYFGNDIRFIQGIHMIPVSPISYYIRPQNFIREEWLRYFSEDQKTGDDGWKGILYSNYALIEPDKAWVFFSSDSFKKTWLDGGASRTWYLALCIMLSRCRKTS